MLFNGSKTETQGSYTVASEFSERDCDISTSSVWDFQSAITWNDKVVIKRAAQTRMPSEWWIQLAVYRAQSQSSAWLTGPSVTCYEFPGCSARISLRSHRLSSSGSLSRLLHKILISSALVDTSKNIWTGRYHYIIPTTIT